MRSLLCLVASVVAGSSLLLGGAGAGAEPTTTTSSTVAPDPTTTSTPSTTTPSSTTIAAPPTTAAPAPDTPTPPPPDAAGGDEPVDESFVLPPELQARVNAVRRSRPNNNARLLDVVGTYAKASGLPLDQAMVLGLGHFPVAGPARWAHDWLHPRRGPPVHLHQGTDVWAAMGTPIRAPYAGRLRYENAGLGGLAAYVTAADGTYYYLAHMSDTASGLESGAQVAQGQVVGFVGDSGDARGGPAHLHFEIHPRGGAAVDPKAILDRWVEEAIAYAFALAANPTATTAPEPAPAPAPADDAALRAVATPRRAVRTADVDAGRGPAGPILVIGALIALCGGRAMRGARASMSSAPPDEP